LAQYQQNNFLFVVFFSSFYYNSDNRYETNKDNEPTGTSSSAGIDFAFEGLYDDDDDDNDLTNVVGTNINKESI
jgi:hypothetical protein